MNEAHTAEHVFMGSLKRVIPDAVAKKVEQTEGRNSLFVVCPGLDWDRILEAERIANKVIDEGRAVKEHFFDSLEEARRAFPGMRAMEERISGRVRVVEVEGYDHAACSMKHASNTKECDYLLVTRYVKAGKDTFQIDFEVGRKAKLTALEATKKCMSTAEILGANLGTVERTAVNLVEELKAVRRRLSAYTERELRDIPFAVKGGVRIYYKIIEGVERRALMERAGKLVREDKAVAILASVNESAFIALSRSPAVNLDCKEVLAYTLMKHQGRGGGKPDFASGMVAKDRVGEAVEALKHTASAAITQ